MEKNIFKVRLFLWCFFSFVLLRLFWLAVVPGGEIVYENDFTKDSFFIGRFDPKERVQENSAYRNNIIIGDPVYFKLRTSRIFSNANISLKYRRIGDTSNLPIIEAGVLVDKNIWRYRTVPIENAVLDGLLSSGEWKKITNAGIMLLEHHRDNYRSIPDFLNNLPSLDKIAVYNYAISPDYILPDYKADIGMQTFDFPLRGSWQAYTYIKNEDLSFILDISDLNLAKDCDETDFNLYYQDKLLHSWHLSDDGIAIDNGQKSFGRQIKAEIAELPEGAYKLEMRAGDDITTERIMTRQKMLAFFGNFRIDVSAKTPISLFTDSAIVYVQTINPASLQSVVIGNKILDINETFKQFSLMTFATSSKIIFEKSDIILAGNGVFALRENSLINPRVKKVDQFFQPERFDYILSEYSSPQIADGWKKASVKLDLADAYRENRAYGLMLSIPGLKADDDIADGIEIDNIRIELFGNNLFFWLQNKITKISDIFKNK
jgi:hypothetical protein